MVWDRNGTIGVLNVGHLGSGTLIITNGGIVSDEDPGTPDIPVINAIGNLVGSTGNVNNNRFWIAMDKRFQY